MTSIQQANADLRTLESSQRRFYDRSIELRNAGNMAAAAEQRELAALMGRCANAIRRMAAAGDDTSFLSAR